MGANLGKARRSKGNVAKEEYAERINLFVFAYGQTGNASAAAIAAGYSERNAPNQGRVLMNKPEVASRACAEREKFINASKDAFAAQQARLRQEADVAIDALADIMRGPKRDPDGNPTDPRWYVGSQARAQAAMIVLDRAGHKPIERVQQEVAWADVSREIADMDVEAVLVDAVRAIRHDKPSD